MARLKDALWVEPRFQLKERFRKGRWAEENKKSTFRAFASRANKPFAGKFAEKSLKIVSL